jgi:outer membrane protein OmpA-like peptidoglycan-associated protein
VTSTSITILDQIAFVGVSSVLDPVSFPMLDAVAATLDGNPSIRAMEVSASGADGPAQWQRLLGEERARAIVDYLVHQGVDRVRLRPLGTAQVPVRTAFSILQRD